jgi:nicotinic acid mononucleotide adenylyltransferase
MSTEQEQISAAEAALKEKIRTPEFDLEIPGYETDNVPTKFKDDGKDTQYSPHGEYKKPFVICVGGSYSPPTQAHLDIARLAALHAKRKIGDEFDSVIVFIVQLKHTYRKPSVVFPGSDQHRLNMLQLCVDQMNEGIHKDGQHPETTFRVSDIEIDADIFPNEKRKLNTRDGDYGIKLTGLEVNTYETLNELIKRFYPETPTTPTTPTTPKGALVFGQDNIENILQGNWNLQPSPFFKNKMFGIARDRKLTDPVFDGNYLKSKIKNPINIQEYNGDITEDVTVNMEELKRLIDDNFEVIDPSKPEYVSTVSTSNIAIMSSTTIRDLLKLRVTNPSAIFNDIKDEKLRNFLKGSGSGSRNDNDQIVFDQALKQCGLIDTVRDYIYQNGLYGTKSVVALSGGRRRTKTQKRRTRRVRRTRRRRRHSRRKL